MEGGTGPRGMAVEQPTTSGTGASWKGTDGAKRNSATGGARHGTCELASVSQVVLALEKRDAQGPVGAGVAWTDAPGGGCVPRFCQLHC
jgi:hypothetical protein